MNQIEWCQVRLDITQEIQVTRRSKLPGDPSYPEIQATRRSDVGKFTRRSGTGIFTRRSSTGKFTNHLRDQLALGVKFTQEIQLLGNLPRDPALGNLPGDLRHWEIYPN